MMVMAMCGAFKVFFFCNFCNFLALRLVQFLSLEETIVPGDMVALVIFWSY